MAAEDNPETVSYEAWRTIIHILEDGLWHDRSIVVEIVAAKYDLQPKTIVNIMQRATRRRLIQTRALSTDRFAPRQIALYSDGKPTTQHRPVPNYMNSW